ncbi:hypothetical protein ACSBR2_015767 [Camellia fascicularis]
MVLLFVSTIPSQHCSAIDTLIQSQPISVGQTLISSGQIFELGFFSPVIPLNNLLEYGTRTYLFLSVKLYRWQTERILFQQQTLPQVKQMRGSPWDESKFIGIPDSDMSYDNGFSLLTDNHQGKLYLTMDTYNTSDVKIMALTPNRTLEIMKR